MQPNYIFLIEIYMGLTKAILIALVSFLLLVSIPVFMELMFQNCFDDGHLYAIYIAISFIISLFSYRYLNKKFIPRLECDLPIRGSVTFLRDGFCFGCFLIISGALILWFLSLINIEKGTFSLSEMLVFSVIGAPLVEEIFFRGVLLRYISLAHGKFIGLFISSLAFGLLHLRNDNADIWSSMNIAFGSGILFGILYLACRNLWLPIGAHAGWNFAEGVLLGSANSGATIPGFLRTTPSGPIFLSGGAFGLEGSVILTFICAAFSLLILRRIRRYGHL